jgi:hypothetical protein
VRLETLLHALGVPLGLELVLAELVPDRLVVGRLDHPVQHPQDVLLHRVRLVDVLDELLFQVFRRHHPSSALDSLQLELAELAAAKRRPPAIAVAVGLELVDEAAERSAIAQREPDDVERRARQATELRRTCAPCDLLANADHRRQRAADAFDIPGSVELFHDD